MHAVTTAGEKPAAFAVVLAAGGSQRFGRSKLLEPVQGEPLVRRAANLAREVCGDCSLLVTGHERAAVTAAAGDAVRFMIVNDRYEDGIGVSIALAAKAVSHAADALLLLFADQPLVTPRHLRALLAAWDGSDREIVATAFSGILGPPVLFPRGAFTALGRLSGDTGAKSVLQDSRFDVRTVAFEDAAIDIDTPADLEKLRK
ncbi:MAG TPA: nucleotidyltransferase family protein [Woeseiaceae bacterium]|nr:nucleotidyltransferase family protein [Woeseiaceae bacterium]